MISLLLYLVLLWILAVLALLAGFHGRTLRALWREPVLSCPVVIIESDDWGVGPASDGAVLARIATQLADIRDVTGRPAVMTLGLVSGQPDGQAILASGLTRYRRRTLDDPAFSPIVEAIRAGCGAGVFAVQWHGLEHCWPDSLLACARNDADLQRWLADPDARSETLPPALQSRWVDASALPSRVLARTEIEVAVSEEASLLKRVFGEIPTVAVPNTFVWNDDVEHAWAVNGVTCIVTPGRRIEGRDARGGLHPPTRIIRNGDRTASGAIQAVRDEYFEPIRGHRAEQVCQSVATKQVLGRPTLIETHRENFVGGSASGEAALVELERALRGVLARHPEARFMPTAELAKHLADLASPLRERAFAHRLHAFLNRIAREGSLARFLKYSGLGLLLQLVLPTARA